MASEDAQIVDPSTLAWWSKAVREASHWSQEAVAEAAGLTVRTIQRIEAGKPSSITTRRALARGLGYEDQNVFLDPQFAKGISELTENIKQVTDDAIKRQFPDLLRLPAEIVRSGDRLGRLFEVANAYHFYFEDNLAAGAKEAAAALFDYLKDYGDAKELYSESDRLHVYNDLGDLLHELERQYARVYSALRATKVAAESWSDKTPMRVDIAYLTVASADRRIQEIHTSKKLRFSF